MLRPLLIIGTGGSGGKTIRAMKQAMKRRLESVRYEGELPAAWQFLQIDTTRDGIDFPAPMLPDDEFYRVVKRGDDFASVLGRITSTGNEIEQHSMLGGWGIPKSAITITDGAGQIRAIGRQAGMSDSKGTLDALRSAIGKMSGPAADGELRTVATALGIEKTVTEPRAFIISSLAGGSGAGMFMDVAELLKRAVDQPWASETISFLYTSEVFESLKAAGANISKNSLGAMNEMTASKWVGLSNQTHLLYSKLGLANSANSKEGEYGCAGNILVGSRNKANVDLSIGADAAGMDEVFLTIGEALAGSLTNGSISEFFFNQAFVNITQTRASIDKSGLAPDPGAAKAHVNPTFAAAAIGFGQLSLGSDRIVDYVADAMTKRQVKTLLYPDLSPEALKDGKTKQELIEDMKKQIWPNFLDASGLSEKGNQNQIINEIFPEDYKDSSKKFVTSLVNSIVTDKQMSLDNFLKVLWTRWDEESEEFQNGLNEKIEERARKWVPKVQNTFKDTLANELTQSGYYVTTSLVQDLHDQLKNEVIGELNAEHTKYASGVEDFNQSLFRSKILEFGAGLAGVSKQNSAFIEKVKAFLANVPQYQVQAYVYDLSSSLVSDLLQSLLEPVIQSLNSARSELHRDQKAPTLNNTKNLFGSYPEWDSKDIPKRYMPRSIERILIDPSDFKSIYEFYASRDSGGNPPFQQSVTYALQGIKMNVVKGAKNEQTLITEASRWSTGIRDAQEHKGGSSSQANWQFETNLDVLAKRNRKWLKNLDSAFGKFTTMSIREFVNSVGEPPEVKQSREDRFVSEYGAMMSLAQPLAKFNVEAFKNIDSVGVEASDALLPKSSKIPFKSDSRVGIACTSILKNLGVDTLEGSFTGKWFDQGDDQISMFATSTTSSSLPAWAFASLTEPILEQVAQAKNAAGTWIQFWEGRRSRPLPEAVPFETEMRLSIIAGWFIASIFGLRNVKRMAVGRTVEIWNPTLLVPANSQFPSPLLNTHIRDNKEENWVLPQLLTSAGIALAEFGKTGKIDHLHGYHLLKYLGREVTTIHNNRDAWDDNGSGDLLPTGERRKSTYLGDWLDSGSKPSEKHELIGALVQNLSTESDRHAALLKTVEDIRNSYSKYWEGLTHVKWYDLPETWELRDDINLVLDDIRDFVLQSTQTSSGTIA
jgi:hypothetical protein